MNTPLLLADGLAGAMLYMWAIAGLACLVIAILVEIPVMALIWRRFSWLVVVLIVVANLASACIGGIPARMFYSPWDITSDPWVTYNRYWRDFLPWLTILFAATCVIEGLCLLPLRKRKRISFGRLMAGTLVGNVVSYLILTGIIWYLPPNGTGDFEFLPDTSWVQAGDRRVWFLDPASNHLCSIRLDGRDRRTETDQELNRFYWFPENRAIYALIPERNLILYIDTDRNWRVRETGEERFLSKLPAERNYFMRPTVFEWFPELLPEVITPVKDEDKNKPEYPKYLEGVYFSAGAPYWRYGALGKECEVRTSFIGLIGADSWGVYVTVKGGRTLRFGVKRGITQLFCREPEILEEENLILFRCGGWIMVMDPVQRKVGQLVRGESMVVETPFFSSNSYE